MAQSRRRRKLREWRSDFGRPDFLGANVLQLRALILVLSAGLPIVGLSEELPRDIEVSETVEISTADREALLAAPRELIGQPQSIELTEAIRAGTVETIKVDKTIERLTSAVAEEIGQKIIITYTGWIRYVPIVQARNRLFRPVILCVSQSEEINWMHCQDMSLVELQTADMATPIRFHGDLQDEHVGQIFDFIDGAALISKSTGQPLTSDSISQISKHPYSGARVTVSVKSPTDPCHIDVIFLTQTTDANGHSAFEISEIQWAQE